MGHNHIYTVGLYLKANKMYLFDDYPMTILRTIVGVRDRGGRYGKGVVGNSCLFVLLYKKENVRS